MKHNESVGLGTAAIGRPQYINIRTELDTPPISLDQFRQRGMAILEKAYTQGVRYFDTAPGYGMAEDLLLEWLSGKEDPSIEVATKWGYTYVADFDPKAAQHEVKEHSLQKLNEQWEKSKSLLPFLTTYQIHSATFESGVLENQEILNRLAELKAAHGLLIGLSSTGANQVDVLRKGLSIEINGKALFDTFQITYNIFDQSIATLAPIFTQNNKRLIIKEALANGRIFPNKNYPHYQKIYSVLETLADKYNTGIDAIALRFCIDSLSVYKVLSGAANEAHLIDNLKVNDFKLDQGDINLLRSNQVAPAVYWNERKKLGWN